MFSEAIGVPPRFQGQKSGIPGPGEQLRIVAINRTTGYTGTATMTLGDAATGDNTLFAGSINQVVPKITLTPPNLKIWARRLSTIEHGLTADEQAEFLIGHEGAATRDDTLIAVFSEWLDEDDKPLPDGLGTNKGQDFGLTGRLAKLSGGVPSACPAGLACLSSRPICSKSTQIQRLCLSAFKNFFRFTSFSMTKLIISWPDISASHSFPPDSSARAVVCCLADLRYPGGSVVTQ